jgi:hypothetical protein
MLKIERSEDSNQVTFSLSGRIEESDVAELRRLLDAEPNVKTILLDLEEVRLVDRDTVKFLATREAQGIKLKNCPTYIREWIEQGTI